MGALSTVDPGDIHETLAELQRHRIRCSVVSLSAELYIARHLTLATAGAACALGPAPPRRADATAAGTYSVATNRRHYQDLLTAHVAPVPTAPALRMVKKWIKMGFPQRRADQYPSLCEWSVCGRPLGSAGMADR